MVLKKLSQRLVLPQVRTDSWQGHRIRERRHCSFQKKCTRRINRGVRQGSSCLASSPVSVDPGGADIKLQHYFGFWLEATIFLFDGVST